MKIDTNSNSIFMGKTERLSASSKWKYDSPNDKTLLSPKHIKMLMISHPVSFHFISFHIILLVKYYKTLFLFIITCTSINVRFVSLQRKNKNICIWLYINVRNRLFLRIYLSNRGCYFQASKLYLFIKPKPKHAKINQK